MKPASIRWKQYTSPEAKRACAEWLRGQGLSARPIIGDYWLVRRTWQ